MEIAKEEILVDVPESKKEPSSDAEASLAEQLVAEFGVYDPTKDLDGYFYIVEYGENFYKFGISENQKRIYDHNVSNKVEQVKQKFPEEKYHKNSFIVFYSLHKIKNVKSIEQNIKYLVSNNEYCSTYDTLNGDDIMEYFHCDTFYINLFPEILKELKIM